MSPFHSPSINELAYSFATESHPEINLNTRAVVDNKFLAMVPQASPHNPAEIAAKAACEILAYYYNAYNPLLVDLETDRQIVADRMQEFAQKVQNG